MPDVHIEREHALGMARGRQVVAQWSERVQQAHGVQCNLTRGRAEDLTRFHRAGLDGILRLRARHVDLHIKLGFLMGLFSTRIGDAVSRELDALLGAAAARRAGPKLAAASPTRPKRAPATKSAARKSPAASAKPGTKPAKKRTPRRTDKT